MKIDGVYDVKGDTNNMYVYVTFDPAKTDVSAFIKALSPKSYFVRGAPVFIK